MRSAFGFSASDLASVVPALLHYSELTSCKSAGTTEMNSVE